MKKITASALFFLLMVNVAFGQLKKEYYMLVKKADSLFTLKDYKGAAEYFADAFKAQGDMGMPEDRYKTARALTMTNDPDGAFEQLFRIIEKSGFRDYDRVVKEENFLSLHEDPRWKELLTALKAGPFSNMGFEKVSDVYKIPNPWFRWGTKNYELRVDSTVKHSGKYSLRIAPIENIDGRSFGCVALAIPAIYEGDDIEVRAYIKMENTTEPIGLMIREDGTQANSSLEFDNMQHKGIMGTKDWTLYKVKLPLRTGATMIYIGAILSGGGTLWVDDIEVLIDNKNAIDAPKKRK